MAGARARAAERFLRNVRAHLSKDLRVAPGAAAARPLACAKASGAMGDREKRAQSATSP